MKSAVVSDTLLCTVLLVDKDRSLYTELRDGRYRLLRVFAPTMQRIASVIQAEIYGRFELHCVILDYPPNPDRNSCCAVAYLLSRMHGGVRLVQTSIDQITEEDLSEIQRKYLADFLGDRIADPLCRIAWFDEAVKWIESVMGVPPERQGPIVQMNAGKGFMLLRFSLIDGRRCWLKSTRDPNRHELAATQFLCSLVDSRQLSPRPVPILYAVKQEWNAWLLSGEGTSLSVVPTSIQELYGRLREAIRALAQLQLMSSEHMIGFLEHGTFDHRISTWRADAHRISDSLEKLFDLQECDPRQKQGDIGRGDLVRIWRKVLLAIEELEIPPCLLHGDLNWGNLVFAEGCQFIDWSEASVGCPLISLWHLFMLVSHVDEDSRRTLRRVLFEDYCQVWANSGIDTSALKRAFRYAPFLAAFSALYARGDWFTCKNRTQPASAMRVLAHLLREASGLRQAGAV